MSRSRVDAMIIAGVVMALLGGLEAAVLGGGGGGGGRAGAAWQDDRIVFQEDEPWNGRSYSFGFQTLFGSSRREKAELKENAHGVKYLDVEGEYSYPSDDGSLRRVLYRANDRGYRQSDPIVTNQLDNPDEGLAKIFSIDGKADKTRIQMRVDKQKNSDRIYFPTDFEATTPPPNSVLTTSIAPATAGNATNMTSIDYYYDELGNRVGGIPPAVLGSLLG